MRMFFTKLCSQKLFFFADTYGGADDVERHRNDELYEMPESDPEAQHVKE